MILIVYAHYRRFHPHGSQIRSQKRVIQAGDLALLINEWLITGNEPDGKPINLVDRGTVVLRQQHDKGWLILIENPWGID